MRRGLALAAIVALAVGGIAEAERAQRGDLIVSLDGGISPLTLPRDHPAPLAIHLEGGLQRVGGELLPRVKRLEIGLPAQGVLSTVGLPTCTERRLRDAKPAEALAACRDALVGRGRLQAQIQIPKQAPFLASARLLAFNGRASGRRMVILHAYAPDPPTVVVLPFYLGRERGRLGLVLKANLLRALGPWPRLTTFDLTLSRRYRFRGRTRSYLSASCPAPPRNTAGFLSLAKMTFTFVGGRSLGVGIARSCRAR